MKIINAIIDGKTTKLVKGIDHKEHDRFVSKFFKSKIEDIVSVKEGMFKVEVTEVYI